MQEGASGSSTGMQSETWQAEENSREEESQVRAEGAGGGDRWRGAMVEGAQGHPLLQRLREKMGEKEKHGRKTKQNMEFIERRGGLRLTE